MRIAGIVCEYNPFHNGHKYQIKRLREAGYDCIVGVMSGNYTERGEMAIADKYTRAKAAVDDSVDLILELPFPYSAMSAEGFARAGVHILSSIGVDTISFGSESADIELLSRAARIIVTEEFKEAYSQKKADGSASGYFDTLSEFLGEKNALRSNDILGVAYMAAINELGAKVDVLPIKRVGLQYNDSVLKCVVNPSATALRAAMEDNSLGFFSEFEDYIPKEALSVLQKAQNEMLCPVYVDPIDREILSFFKLMTPAEIVARAKIRSGGGRFICEDGCGLLERICNAAKSAKSIDSLLEASHNSRYTDARVRRVMLFSLLGVTDTFSRSLPDFTTVLAANATGRSLLANIRKCETLPVITKPADAPDGALLDISRLSDLLYASAMRGVSDSDYFIKAHPFMAE